MDSKQAVIRCSIQENASGVWLVEGEGVETDCVSIPKYVPMKLPAQAHSRAIILHFQYLVGFLEGDLLWSMQETPTWKKLYHMALPNIHNYLKQLTSDEFRHVCIFVSRAQCKLLEKIVMEFAWTWLKSKPNWFDPKLSISTITSSPAPPKE